MNEDRTKILEMLKQGKITVDEANELIDALQASTATDNQLSVTSLPATASGQKPRYLRVVVDDSKDHVDVRVPFNLIRAGIKLGSFMPEDMQNKLQLSLKEKGIDLDLSNIKPEMVEELIDSLSELNVNVNEKDKEGTVRVFCE